MNLVYWLFRHKGWRPSDYWDMPPGEKVLVSAMASLENETPPPQPRCPLRRG